jgi:1,4-alpha-glucan branching enzyme
VPSFAGSFAVRTPAGTRFDVAIVQRFISGAVDEFETLADRLAAWLRAGADEADGTELLTEVGAVGRTVARLHVGLGGLTGRGLRPREATPADRSAWRRRARRALAEGLRSVSAMDPELAARLEGRRPELEQALGPLLGLDDRGGRNPWLTRIHGDLHVGQLIRDRSADGRFLVVDLEGEPTRTAAERRRVDLPLRDIASMLRAYDHIGRSAIRRAGSAMPGSHTSVVDAWLARARTTFLDAYRAGRSAAGLEPELDPAMLHALEVEKELYEFAYAARYLPDWRYAPAAGLGWLLETRHG